MTDPSSDIRDAREDFPATAARAYLNTAAVGLASRALADAYRGYVDDWVTSGPDWLRGGPPPRSSAPIQTTWR